MQWKETLESVKEKTGQLLEKLRPVKRSDISREHITEDLLPAFMQLGGPFVDMHESAEELIVSVEVPGLKKDDFAVELVGRRLMIRGEKKASRQRKGAEGSYISECSYGSFARSVQLPYDIKDSSVRADLKNGVLTVRMPKSESAKKQQHRVTIS